MHTTATPHNSVRWQPHRTIQRVVEGDEPDFTELGYITCGEITLTPRQHQVTAMFASGFQSDRIVADYLGITAKYVQNLVADLKKQYGWQSRREMARAYETMRETVTVKPKGVKRMELVKNTVTAMSANGHTAADEPPTAPPPARPRREPVAAGEFDPAAVYPARVVEAAWGEMEKEPMGRRCKNVFTAEVVAVWLDWLDQGKSKLWIAEYNGLMPTSYATVQSYVAKYRYEAEQLRSSEGWSKAAAPNKPEVRRVAPLSPNVTDQLTEALAAVLGAASFSGKIRRTKRGLKIDIEIEFGD